VNHVPVELLARDELNDEKFNEISIVSDEDLSDIREHIKLHNKGGLKLLNVVHRGNVLMMFWEKIK
jgi:hypothetical protein